MAHSSSHDGKPLPQDVEKLRGLVQQAQTDAIKYKKLAKQLVLELKATKASLAETVANASVDNSSQENGKLRETVQNLEDNLSILKSKVDAKDRKISMLQQELKEFSEKQQTSEPSFDDNQQQLHILTEENEAHKNEIEEMLDLLRMLVIEVIVITPSIGSSSAPEDPNQWNFDQILDALTSFLSQHKFSQLKSPDSDIAKAERKVTSLEKDVAQLQQELEIFRKKDLERDDSPSFQNNNVKNDQEDLKEEQPSVWKREFKKAVRRIQELEEEVKVAKESKNTSSDKMIAQKIQSLENLSKSLKKEKEELIFANMNLEKTLALLEDDVDETKQKLEEATLDLRELEIKKQELEDENSLLSEKVSEAAIHANNNKHDSNEWQERHQELEKELIFQEKETNSYKAQSKELRELLDNEHLKRDKILKELKQRSSVIERLQEEMDTLRIEKDSSQNEMQSKLQQAYTRIENLTTQIEAGLASSRQPKIEEFKYKYEASNNEINEMLDLLRMLIVEVIVVTPTAAPTTAPQDPNDWNFDQILDALTTFLTFHKKQVTKDNRNDKYNRLKAKNALLEAKLQQRHQEMEKLKEEISQREPDSSTPQQTSALKELQEDHFELTRKLAMTQGQFDALKERYDLETKSYQEKAQAHQTTIDDLHHQLSSRKGDIHSLQDTLEDFKQHTVHLENLLMNHGITNTEKINESNPDENKIVADNDPLPLNRSVTNKEATNTFENKLKRELKKAIKRISHLEEEAKGIQGDEDQKGSNSGTGYDTLMKNYMDKISSLENLLEDFKENNIMLLQHKGELTQSRAELEQQVVILKVELENLKTQNSLEKKEEIEETTDYKNGSPEPLSKSLVQNTVMPNSNEKSDTETELEKRIVQLQEEVLKATGEAERSLKDSERKEEEANNTILDLQNEIESKNQQLRTLEADCDLLNQQSQLLKTSHMSEMEELQTKLRNKEDEMAQLEDAKSALENNLASLEAKMELLNQQLQEASTLQERLSISTEGMNQLQKEKDEFSREMEKTKQHLSDLQEQMEIREKDIHENHSQQNQDLETLKKEKKTVENEMKQLQNKVESDIQGFEEQIQSLRNDKEKLAETIQELERQLLEIKDVPNNDRELHSNRSLEEEKQLPLSDPLHELKEELSAMAISKEALQKQYEDLEMERGSVLQELGLLEEKIKDLLLVVDSESSEMTMSSPTFVDTTFHNSSIFENLDQLKKKVLSKKSDILKEKDDLIAEVHNLQDTIRMNQIATTEDLASHKSEIELLQEKIKEYTGVLELEKKRVQELEEKMAQHEQGNDKELDPSQSQQSINYELESLNTENQILLKKVKTLEGQITDQEPVSSPKKAISDKELASLKGAMALALTKKQKMKKEYDALKTVCENNEKRNLDLEEELQVMKEVQVSLNEKKEILEIKVSELELAILSRSPFPGTPNELPLNERADNELQLQLDQVLEEKYQLEQSLEKLNSELEKNTSTLSDLKSYIANLEEQESHANDKISSYKDDIRKLKEELESRLEHIEQLKMENEKLLQVSKAAAEVSKEDSELDSLRSRNQDLENEISALTLQLNIANGIREEFEILQKEMADKTIENEHFIHQQREVEHKYEQEIEELHTTIHSLRQPKEIESTEPTKNDMMQQIEDLEIRIKKFETEVSQLRGSITVLSDEKMVLQQSIDKFEIEHHDLLQQRDELLEKLKEEEARYEVYEKKSEEIIDELRNELEKVKAEAEKEIKKCASSYSELINNIQDQLLESENKHRKWMEQASEKEQELVREIEVLKKKAEEENVEHGGMTRTEWEHKCLELQEQNAALKEDVDSLSLANMELVSKLASM